MVPALMTAAQPTGGRSRPRDRRVTASDVPNMPSGLPTRKASRMPIVTGDPAARAEHVAVDGDPGVGQCEQRHDGVARPGVVEGEQPLVGRDGGAQASARRALELRRGLLAEPAETLGGPVQLGAADGTSAEQQAERQAEHDRLDARLEQRHPAARRRAARRG